MKETNEYPKLSLKAARINAHMIQKVAAKELGISPVTLGNYESGASVPDVLMADRMSKLYGVPMEYISFSKS